MIEPQQWLVSEPQYLHPQHARFQFEGKFNQRDVIWHCDLHTLKHYVQSCHPESSQREWQQRIIIHVDDDRHHITVALNLAEINRSAVYKTIIMVRNYKRLREGEHCYGPAYKLDKEKDSAGS